MGYAGCYAVVGGGGVRGDWGCEREYAVLQTTLLSCEEPQKCRDSDFHSFLCCLFPSAAFVDFLTTLPYPRLVKQISSAD